MSEYSPDLEKAHPNAKRLMNEDFFWSPIEETGPFGNDDGADCYAGFAQWRRNNLTENPHRYLEEQIDYWGYPSFNIGETDIEKLKPYLSHDSMASRYMTGIDAAIVAIAFGQLYLEGIISVDFRETAKTAIRRELLPELLALYDASYQETRKMKLEKMLSVLIQINPLRAV